MKMIEHASSSIFFTQIIVSTCTSSALISIDHIIELRTPCKILAQDVSRRFKAFDMHFESRIIMSTKDGFDSMDSYLIQTDW